MQESYSIDVVLLARPTPFHVFGVLCFVWRTSLRSILLHPWQYSCFNRGDPNRSKLISVTETDPEYAVAMQLAADALSGKLPDITNSATHYYDDRMPSMPSWAIDRTPCFILGTQKYFRVVD